jgi:hypothetical protein
LQRIFPVPTAEEIHLLSPLRWIDRIGMILCPLPRRGLFLFWNSWDKLLFTVRTLRRAGSWPRRQRWIISL